MLRPLELVIHDRSLGWVTLGYSPGVDLSQPVALVLDDRKLGPVTIGWIMPGEVTDPLATTIPLTFHSEPLPGHQSLHRPEAAAVGKAGYGATEAGGASADDEHPSVDAGTDAPARSRATSFLWEFGESLNPISTAQAAGPEDDERAPFEEFLDPLAPVRIARFNSLLLQLRRVDPGNLQNDSLTGPNFVPSEEDIRQVEGALDEALRRNDPIAEPPAARSPEARQPLFTRPPGGSPYDVIVEFRTESDIRDFMRRGGASEPEIDAAVERFRREQHNQEPTIGDQDPIGADQAAKPAPSPQSYGRTHIEFEDLARDPSQGFRISAKTEQERRVGLDLESRGELEGPIKRDPTGRAEFIDREGQKWDVKTFNSNFPRRTGGFTLKDSMNAIEESFVEDENVILDTSNLNQEHMDELKAEVESRGWDSRIRWWP